MVVPSPRVAEEGPVRIEDAREAYERGGNVDVEPPGKPEARPADRVAPEICLATLAPVTKNLMKRPGERKARDATRGARRSR